MDFILKARISGRVRHLLRKHDSLSYQLWDQNSRNGKKTWLQEAKFESTRARDIHSALLSRGTKSSWKTISQLLRALERENVKSLQRPILAGLGPNGFAIA
jgi:hypothetical protein